MAEDVIEITPYDTPWEVACKIINADYKHTNMLSQEVVTSFFSKDELRRIGEHIVKYCDTEMEET